jgi:hypothetical protein
MKLCSLVCSTRVFTIHTPVQKTLFHLFQKFDSIKNFSFGGFLHLPRQNEFVQNTVYLAEIKDNVKFAHVAGVLSRLETNNVGARLGLVEANIHLMERVPRG